MTTVEGSPTTDVAKEQASQVGGAAKDQAAAVAGTAKDQAGQVVADARSHAQDLVGQATDQLTAQSTAQAQRLAGNLRQLSHQLGGMAESGEPGSTAHTLVQEASRRSSDLAGYLDGRDSQQILRDVTDFARRRPGAFILGAGMAGLLAGRLGRAVKDAPGETSAAVPVEGGAAAGAVCTSDAGTVSGGGFGAAAAVAGSVEPGDAGGELMAGDHEGSRAAAAGQFGTDLSGASAGELIGEIAADLSSLMRQEIELAKAEVKAEAAKAGKAAGMLGGAGFAGYMVLVFGSLAVTYAIGGEIGWGWGALIVTAVWAVAGAVLGVAGRARLKSVNPKPELATESIKEDVAWAKHPNS